MPNYSGFDFDALADVFARAFAGLPITDPDSPPAWVIFRVERRHD